MSGKYERCQAIASSTGDQCKKKPIKWSHFCWWHSLRQRRFLIGGGITIAITIAGIIIPILWTAGEIVNSSNIDVCLKLSVNERTQRELDSTSFGGYTCYLHAKSGHILVFRSGNLQTRLIRTENQYEWQFSAVLPPQDNIYRENPKEFLEATIIVVPMAPFVRLIRGDLSPKVVCTLKSAKVDFYVNSSLVNSSEKSFAENTVVEESTELTVALNKETDR